MLIFFTYYDRDKIQYAIYLQKCILLSWLNVDSLILWLLILETKLSICHIFLRFMSYGFILSATHLKHPRSPTIVNKRAPSIVSSKGEFQTRKPPKTINQIDSATVKRNKRNASKTFISFSLAGVHFTRNIRKYFTTGSHFSRYSLFNRSVICAKVWHGILFSLLTFQSICRLCQSMARHPNYWSILPTYGVIN